MKNYRVNGQIKAHRVRLIDSDGSNRGEFLRNAALDRAWDQNLDLVEVSSGKTPVCKIIDYGKLLYDQKKSEKKNQHVYQTKEIKFNYKTDPHDIEHKYNKAVDLLTKGHKVNFIMTLKGRERHIADDAAYHKFVATVDELFKDYKTSDILDTGNAYKVTISPNKV